jgi:hypothetical protein
MSTLDIDHDEHYDRLIVAVSDVKLREEVNGQPSSEILMRAGDTKRFARGVSHAVTTPETPRPHLSHLSLNSLSRSSNPCYFCAQYNCH